MTIKTTYSDLEQYKKRVEHRLNELIPVFARATIGDFSKDVPFTENEDEFSELYVGVQVMLDVIRDKLGKLGKWNDELADRIAEKTRAFEEAQYLTHIGSWECDVEKGKLDLSDEMYRIYGLQKQTKPIDYGTFLQYVHPDDRERVGDCVNLSLKSLKPFNIFYRIVRDDGSVRILQGRGKVEADWDGNPVRVLGTGQDVTDLKRVEDELIYARNNLEKKVKERTTKLKRALEDLRKEMARREEVQAKAERLAAIVEGTYDAILSKTLDGTITSWNKAAQRLYGYSPKEAIGKNVAIIVPDERKDELENILLRLSQGKMIKRLETIRRHKNGHLVYVSLTISPIYNSAGEVIGASSIAKDITREVAAQHQMKKSQIRLNNFMNAARDVFAIYDHELRLVDINKAGVKLLGERSKKNLIGKHMNEIFPSIKGTEHQALYEKVLLKGRSKRLETFLSHDVFGNRFFAIEIFKLDEGIGVISRDITQQKQSDQALNESERKYRTLVETMNEGVLIVNNDDVIEFVNETFCRQSGYPMEELVGQKAMDLLLDEDERERMKHMILKRQDGEASQYEIRIKTKWGQKLWMLVNGSPVYSNANEIIGSVGLHTNINQRKQHEAELDALARFPAENPSPVMRFSMRGQALIYVNRAAVHLVDCLDRSHELRKQWNSLINKVYIRNQVTKEEMVIENRNYLFTIVPIRDGHYVNLYGTDITMAKQAEEEVKRLLFVLSQTDNSIMIADADGTIRWVNAAFKRISGYSLENVKGTHGEILRHGKSTGLDPRHPYFKRMIKTRRSVSYECKNFAKSGKEYWTLTTITPVLNDKDEIEGIVAMDSDVTEKKKAEKALLKAKKIAESSAKAREMFLANMSHEIRTPMNAIMGIIQLLRETSINSQQNYYLKSMEFAGENLMRIIDDVLDLSKIESGKLSIEEQGFDIVEMVRDLVNSVAYRAHEQGIEMKLDLDIDIPPVVVGDPVRINQILLNLVSNAIKFTHEGGVQLSVKVHSQDQDKCLLRFMVADSGIGIPKEKQEQIFEEFEQAHKGNTRKYGGTGLGLSIVKRLTSMMDGRMKLQSKEGKGTTFTIDLPFRITDKPLSENATEDMGRLRDVLSDKCILLVEDNKLNQMVASDFLASMGIKVCIANDGQEAMEWLRKQQADLVLMDIQMPRMDGYETTRMIREELKSPVPIIAMTAHAINGEERRCKAAGMNDYISKPLKKITLYKKIAQLISKKT